MTKNTFRKPKYKVGELVFYDRRPDHARTIKVVRESEDPSKYHHTYKIFLVNKQKELYLSDWINEPNLSKTKPY